MRLISAPGVRKLGPGLVTSTCAWSFHQTGSSLVKGRNPLCHGEPQNLILPLQWENAERQVSCVHTSSLLHVETASNKRHKQ